MNYETEDFITKDGHIKRIPQEGDYFENQHWFTVQKLLLTMDNGLAFTSLFVNLLNIVDKCKGKLTGDYANHWHAEVLSRHPKLSHDQMLSYCFMSEKACKEIWEDTRWMKYYGERVALREWIYIGILNKDKRAYLLSPWLMVLVLGSFLLKYSFKVKGVSFENDYYKRWEIERGLKNSGCILWWGRLKTLDRRGFKRFYQIFKLIAEPLCNYRFGSCKGMFEEFYYSKTQPMHPNLQFETYQW